MNIHNAYYYEGFSQQSNSQWEVNENRYITMSSHDPVHDHMISHVITSKLISLIMLNEEFTLMSGISWRSLSRDPVTAGRVWIARRRFVHTASSCPPVVRLREGQCNGRGLEKREPV